MPRDKSATNARVLEAARNIFLEKGFEKTSIRDIAAGAGITSAGLYRHCEDKEDLFCQVVAPAIAALHEWTDNHINTSYKSIENKTFNGLESQSEIDMVREVGIPFKKEFQLLISKSAGTKYENFIHDIVEEHEIKMWEGIKVIKSHGYKVKEMSHEELHILISAYVTALFEPIVHDYKAEDIEHCLSTIEMFFMPGWHELMGL